MARPRILPQMYRGVYAEVYLKDMGRRKKGDPTGSYVVKWTHLCNGRAKWSKFVIRKRWHNFYEVRRENTDWEKTYSGRLHYVLPMEFLRSSTYEV